MVVSNNKKAKGRYKMGKSKQTSNSPTKTTTTTKKGDTSVASGEGGIKKKKPRASRTLRAKLHTSIPRVGGVARFLWPTQVGGDSEVALAAAVEAIMTCILKSAAERAGKKHTILPNDIEWAIRENPWTNRFIPGHVGSVFIKK